MKINLKKATLNDPILFGSFSCFITFTVCLIIDILIYHSLESRIISAIIVLISILILIFRLHYYVILFHDPIKVNAEIVNIFFKNGYVYLFCTYVVDNNFHRCLSKVARNTETELKKIGELVEVVVSKTKPSKYLLTEFFI